MQLRVAYWRLQNEGVSDEDGFEEVDALAAAGVYGTIMLDEAVGAADRFIREFYPSLCELLTSEKAYFASEGDT